MLLFPESGPQKNFRVTGWVNGFTRTVTPHLRSIVPNVQRHMAYFATLVSRDSAETVPMVSMVLRYSSFTDTTVSTVSSGHPVPLGFSVSAVSHSLSGCFIFVGESYGTPEATSSAFNDAYPDSDIRKNFPLHL
jgi:hypothetical protein